MKPSRVLAAGLGTVILWASAFPAVRMAVPALGVLGLTSIRLIVAAVVLLAVAPLFRVRPPKLRHLPTIFLSAILGMFGYQILLNWAEVTIPAGTSSLVASASPLVSAVIAVLFFKERLSKTRVLGLFVAVAGITAICLTESRFSPSIGVLVVVGAMFFYGAYHPLVRPLYSEYSGIEVATYCLVASGLMSLPLLPFAWHDISTAGSTAVISAVYLGVVPSALAFVLWGYALARLPVTTSTSLIFLIPAIAIGISFFWLREVPLPMELGGGLVVLCGVVLSTRGDDLVTFFASRGRRATAAQHALREAHQSGSDSA